MSRYGSVLIALLVVPGLFTACSEPPPAEPAARSSEPVAAPESVAVSEPVAAPEPIAAPEPVAVSEPVAEPEPVAPSVPATTPAVPEATNLAMAVAGKPGATRIGAGKCKMCHKVQHASWAASAHAEQEPVLDCESCHGAGSEYKSMAVMKDPEKASAAGLVNPGKSFCTLSCHLDDWQDELLGRAHAHKDETS